MTGPEITDIVNDAKVATEPPEDAIKRLAQVPTLEYEKQRDQVAKDIGIRVSVLDRIADLVDRPLQRPGGSFALVSLLPHRHPLHHPPHQLRPSSNRRSHLSHLFLLPQMPARPRLPLLLSFLSLPPRSSLSSSSAASDLSNSQIQFLPIFQVPRLRPRYFHPSVLTNDRSTFRYRRAGGFLF